MENKDKFEILIDTINKAEILPKDRLYLTRGLAYFREQSLCDYDRRKRSDILEKEWFEFKKLLSGDQKMLRRFDKRFWSDLEFSLGILNDSAIMPTFPKAVESKFVRFTTEDFFRYLGKKAKDDKKIDPTERYVLMFALYCLRAEASLPKPRREQDMVKLIWKFAHPRLERLGYLEEFKTEQKIKNDVRYFVAGSILGL